MTPVITEKCLPRFTRERNEMTPSNLNETLLNYRWRVESGGIMNRFIVGYV